MDGILDIFNPPDRHGFLANPLENHVEFMRTPPPAITIFSIFFLQILGQFYIICDCIFFTKNQIITIQIKTPNSRNSTALVSAVVC